MYHMVVRLGEMSQRAVSGPQAVVCRPLRQLMRVSFQCAKLTFARYSTSSDEVDKVYLALVFYVNASRILLETKTSEMTAGKKTCKRKLLNFVKKQIKVNGISYIWVKRNASFFNSLFIKLLLYKSGNLYPEIYTVVIYQKTHIW